MALFAYEQRVQRLLRDVKQDFLNPGDLVDYINIARGQIAGEGECIRVLGTIDTVANQREYSFANILLGTPASTGVSGVIHVRRITASAAVTSWLNVRNWEWFDYYLFNNINQNPGTPTQWSQYRQGSAAGNSSNVSGSFFVDPRPDGEYTLTCDCVCYPINLEDDETVEALPYLWTDAIPFFAAYYAYMEIQNYDKAKAQLVNYQQFMQRARTASNPSVNRWMYQQSQDPTQVSKLGLKQQAGAG